MGHYSGCRMLLLYPILKGHILVISYLAKLVGICQVKCYLEASQNVLHGYVILILCHIFALIFVTNHLKLYFPLCGEELIHLEIVKVRLSFMTYFDLEMEEYMPHPF